MTNDLCASLRRFAEQQLTAKDFMCINPNDLLTVLNLLDEAEGLVRQFSRTQRRTQGFSPMVDGIDYDSSEQ